MKSRQKHNKIWVGKLPTLKTFLLPNAHSLPASLEAFKMTYVPQEKVSVELLWVNYT